MPGLPSSLLALFAVIHLVIATAGYSVPAALKNLNGLPSFVVVVLLAAALPLVASPSRIIMPFSDLNTGDKVTIEGTKYKAREENLHHPFRGNTAVSFLTTLPPPESTNTPTSVKSELGVGKNGRTFTTITGLLGEQSDIKEQKRVPFTANELDATKLRGVSKDNEVMVQKPVGTHAIREYFREKQGQQKLVVARTVLPGKEEEATRSEE
ncbi:hypothetical protein DFJ73DRAFT_760699 [Zopfochytrium polystomum]|nr:hypothetical protein DFJ73DRAFT_760699 [Zopfochytrium polystomum]